MSEPISPTPTENVARGSIFALGAIPVAMIGFGLLGTLFGGIGGIAAIVVAPVAGWLYAKGAGTQLTRKGWAPFIAISGVAIVLGVITGIVAATYNGFTSVGGDGGLFGSAFGTTLRNQFTNNLGDLMFPIIIGLGLGVAGIASVLRGNRLGNRGPVPQPDPQAQVNPVQATPVQSAPVQDAANPPAPPAPPTPNTPSPGIMLNGKPLDPDQK